MGSLLSPSSLALPNIITLPSKESARTTCRRHFGSCQTLPTFVNFDDDTVCCDQKMKGALRGRFQRTARARAFYPSLNKVGPTVRPKWSPQSPFDNLATPFRRDGGTGGLLKIPSSLPLGPPSLWNDPTNYGEKPKSSRCFLGMRSGHRVATRDLIRLLPQRLFRVNHVWPPCSGGETDGGRAKKVNQL